MPRIPGLVLWAWFRPAHLPSGVVVTIPADFLHAFPVGLPMTLGDVLTVLGIPPQNFQAVSLYGNDWQAAAVFSLFVNHPLPLVPMGGRAEIAISVIELPAMMPMQPVAFVPAGTFAIPGAESAAMTMQADHFDRLSSDIDAAFEDDSEFEDDGAPLPDDMMFIRIESAWKFSVQIERQMTGLRQRLSSIQSALGKLDRDLSPDERLASDREDRDEWSDTRRWVRDLQSKCHREIKAFDIGMTSGAGNRRHLEETYLTIIEPRVASANLESFRAEFEKYRKDMVCLQRAMINALQAASQNGTQRAQRCLGKISVKIRELRAKNREPLGATNMDRSVRRKR
jgi:hypothetical protein